MSDNPFSEPDDSDRTIIRPVPGGRRPAATPPQPAAAAPYSPPVPPPPVAEGTTDLAVGVNPLVAVAAPLLQLVTRLRNTARPPAAGDLRERAVAQVRAFEKAAQATGIPLEQLRPAHYALCATLDDVVLATPWGGSGGWAERSMVSTFHQEVRSGERFFDLLKQMNDNPGRFMPVIELMYLCMSLGFIGKYRRAPHVPAGIEPVREETYAIIAKHRAAASAELAPHTAGVSAPYRAARMRVPLWVAGAAALAALGGLFIWTSGGLNAASDDLYARMLAAPPATMPAISRAAIVRPPPPPPPSNQPTAVDRLRTFLAPEIAQGLVTVTGTAATPIIRISNRGMFPSGSATVQPNFKPVLVRIGEALKTEPGPAQVIGYTDNQPIRTVAFPSNFQLSTARARAAAAILGEAAGDPGRLTVEGRADADPLAPNTTPEGREQNRRIEIVLHRTGG
ncbi:type VI secretion system protein TssL, long form [Pararoseomonas indoligenes]|uniref:Type VI secretion system protein TssL, long form n=1 Tax=Roseomonas indoligenes TaxID=2820811 RepID=A0A940MPU8_9PROT|nr:type VI secretion system protein TssL, long form [Pararoseomonas indoligenes]MBP0491778.1 type VI secretion system protein TssL, long form [Pararoseomonas indoligenes]